MSATITSIQVYGYNGNGKVKRGSRDPIEESAHQRFNNLKPNRILITGTNLDELTEREIKITYTTGGHSFAVLELVANAANTELDAYFVVWTPANFEIKEKFDTGDLTVTVETVPSNSEDETGTADDVTIEE
jgi:hypothetical protein